MCLHLALKVDACGDDKQQTNYKTTTKNAERDNQSLNPRSVEHTCDFPATTTIRQDKYHELRTPCPFA